MGHGGGKRCKEEGCTKPAISRGTQHCLGHGGGKRCKTDGIAKLKLLAQAAGTVGTAPLTGE